MKLIILSAVFLVDFWLGFLIFLKDKKNRLNLSYFALSISTSIWTLGMFMYYFFSPNYDLVMFWTKVLYFAGSVTAFFYLNFTLKFINFKLKSIAYILIFLPNLFIFYLLFFKHGFIISDIVFRQNNIQVVFGRWWWFYYFQFFSEFIISFYLLYKKMIGSFDSGRSRVAYVFFGSLVTCIAAAIVNFVLPFWGDYRFAWLGPAFLLCLLASIFYAIIKYRLMNIKLVLRQSSVFLMALLFTVVPIFILKYVIQKFSPDLAFWLEIVILMVAASLFPIFKSYFYRFANKYFFSSLYDTKTVVKDLSNKLSSTLETEVIYQSVTEVLTGALHMKAISFLTCSPKFRGVDVLFNSGLNLSGKLKSTLACRVIFGSYAYNNQTLLLDELKNKSNKQDKVAAKVLSEVGIEVMVPLTVKEKSVGVIALGVKESGDGYNSDDLELLRIVGQQTAIALENALLYEETKNFNVKLVKEVERATHELKQANEELKTLDQAKSDFISIASHQLRTPLTVIKGYGSMMLEGSFGKMPKPIEENLQKMYDSNERLIALVEDLLNVSRIESGRLQFNFEQGRLDEMVTNVVEELAPNAAKKNLFLKFNKPSKPLPAICMDKTKLRQVVINLVDNSIKYTETGGITVDLKQDGNNLSFCVADTGMGIKPDNLPNLFKKFSRGENTSVVHTEGTGPGLYVGKMMIEAHGGKIWAESPGEGKGSKFCFEIPIGNEGKVQTAPLNGKVVEKKPVDNNNKTIKI